MCLLIRTGFKRSPNGIHASSYIFSTKILLQNYAIAKISRLA
ncbi:MAG: hypothetical protein ACRC06_09310 [Waterburya sp.]